MIIITLRQLELIKVLVFGKVCFNLAKLSFFVLFIFSFFYCFLFLFGFSFLLFLPVSGQSPPEKIALPVRVRVWVSFRVRARIGGKFYPQSIVHNLTQLQIFFTLLHCCLRSEFRLIDIKNWYCLFWHMYVCKKG